MRWAMHPSQIHITTTATNKSNNGLFSDTKGLLFNLMTKSRNKTLYKLIPKATVLQLFLSQE